MNSEEARRQMMLMLQRNREIYQTGSPQTPETSNFNFIQRQTITSNFTQHQPGNDFRTVAKGLRSSELRAMNDSANQILRKGGGNSTLNE